MVMAPSAAGVLEMHALDKEIDTQKPNDSGETSPLTSKFGANLEKLPEK